MRNGPGASKPARARITSTQLASALGRPAVERALPQRTALQAELKPGPGIVKARLVTAAGSYSNALARDQSRSLAAHPVCKILKGPADQKLPRETRRICASGRTDLPAASPS